MLRISRFNNVARIDSARSFAGWSYYWTTAYLVDGLLIDTGCAYTARELLEAVKSESIKGIINTHSHEDHIGANGLLQHQVDRLKILAHPSALPILAQPRETQPLQPYRRFFWGWPTASIGQPVQDGEVIETTKYKFRVIYTPGHSSDHICLYEYEQGWLFTGDLFVGGRERALRKDNNIWQIIASLKHVASLPLKKLFPGSARVRDKPKEELEAKIAYLEKTGERILALSRNGLSASAIARSVFGRTMWIEIITLGHFTRRNLVESFLTQGG